MAKTERKAIEFSIVKEYFDYKAGLLTWKKIIACSTKKYGEVAGRVGCNNRRVIGLLGNTYYAARLIFLWHKGFLPDCVDHIDGDTLNDNIENLREANFCENSRNRKSAKGSTSKYLGVYLHTDRNRWTSWVAVIRIGKRMKRLGGFKTQERAALAYNKEAVRQWGEFANLNIIKLCQQA